MTIAKVLAAADAVKPNAFTEEVKLQWINEAEGMVQTDIMLRGIEDIVTYEWPKDENVELLARPPHDKLYLSYLIAMIDFTNGEYNKYANTVAMFNTHLSEYAAWFQRTYRPADNGGGFPGYYISAYGIAVNHGFTGSEEAWLASLKGAAGEPGKGFYITGYVATEADLNGIVSPAIGDAYGVGSSIPYDVYTYTASGWVNNGPLQGETGQTGPAGAAGKDGVDGVGIAKIVDNPDYSITIHMTDGKTYTTPSLRGAAGIDGKDGRDGSDGKDGTPATHKWNGTVLTVTSASGTSSADLKGDRGETGKTGQTGSQGQPGKDGVDGVGIESCELNPDYTLTIHLTNGQSYTTGSIRGETGATGQPGTNGTNGISATHAWNGTVLTVTSASGTSSANLKGDKGDKGDTGSGFKVLGYYSSAGALSSGVRYPNIGDAYGVGAAAPYDIYIYSPTGWVNNGPLQGAKGDQGEKGDPFTYSDFTPEQLAALVGPTGATGQTGATGAQGVGIASVTQTTTSAADGGENIVTVTLTNGNKSTFKVKNGSKGSTGDKGDAGYTPQKNVDYFDGKDGKDGTSATHSWNGTILSITSASGTSSANLKGEPGADGSDGVGISSAVLNADYTLTLYFTDGTSYTTPIIRGAAGKNGKDGTSVTVSKVNESSADGGNNVVTFSDGKSVTIKNGSKGSDGNNGKDGKTPVKGTDYWTNSDKTAIVNELKNTNLGYVKTINGNSPDTSGNINVEAGGEKLVATCTITWDGKNEKYTVSNFSHTYQQIKTAYDSGADVVLRASYSYDIPADYTYSVVYIMRIESLAHYERTTGEVYDSIDFTGENMVVFLYNDDYANATSFYWQYQ